MYLSYNKNFRREHPKYGDFIGDWRIPRETFYRFQLSIWKRILDEKHPIYEIWSKIF